MVARFISELAEGTRVDAAFALRAKEMRAARNGDAYLTLELADRTGSLPGVLFRPGPEAAAVPAGSVVRVVGTVTAYRGKRRISVDSMRPASAYDPDELIATSSRPREELVAEFTALVRSVNDSALRSVLRAVFGDKAFFERFQRCPGAQAHHHAYLGGLIEHTVAVASLCVSLADRYEVVDRGLLITAALLHDIGKVDELQYTTSIAYTPEGRLVGHVVLGVQRVRNAAQGAGVEGGRLLRLEHAMLSHHGELEWGSPRRPSTIEALLLHHADNLDTKAAGFASLVSGAAQVDEDWTDAGNLFRRPLYAPRAVEDDRPHRPDEDQHHHRLSA